MATKQPVYEWPTIHKMLIDGGYSPGQINKAQAWYRQSYVPSLVNENDRAGAEESYIKWRNAEAARRLPPIENPFMDVSISRLGQRTVKPVEGLGAQILGGKYRWDQGAAGTLTGKIAGLKPPPELEAMPDPGTLGQLAQFAPGMLEGGGAGLALKKGAMAAAPYAAKLPGVGPTIGNLSERIGGAIERARLITPADEAASKWALERGLVLAPARQAAYSVPNALATQGALSGGTMATQAARGEDLEFDPVTGTLQFVGALAGGGFAGRKPRALGASVDVSDAVPPSSTLAMMQPPIEGAPQFRGGHDVPIRRARVPFRPQATGAAIEPVSGYQLGDAPGPVPPFPSQHMTTIPAPAPAQRIVPLPEQLGIAPPDVGPLNAPPIRLPVQTGFTRPSAPSPVDLGPGGLRPPPVVPEGGPLGLRPPEGAQPPMAPPRLSLDDMILMRRSGTYPPGVDPAALPPLDVLLLQKQFERMGMAIPPQARPLASDVAEALRAKEPPVAPPPGYRRPTGPPLDQPGPRANVEVAMPPQPAARPAIPEGLLKRLDGAKRERPDRQWNIRWSPDENAYRLYDDGPNVAEPQGATAAGSAATGKPEPMIPEPEPLPPGTAAAPGRGAWPVTPEPAARRRLGEPAEVAPRPAVEVSPVAPAQPKQPKGKAPEIAAPPPVEAAQAPAQPFKTGDKVEWELGDGTPVSGVVKIARPEAVFVEWTPPGGKPQLSPFSVEYEMFGKLRKAGEAPTTAPVGDPYTGMGRPDFFDYPAEPRPAQPAAQGASQMAWEAKPGRHTPYSKVIREATPKDAAEYATRAEALLRDSDGSDMLGKLLGFEKPTTIAGHAAWAKVVTPNSGRQTFFKVRVKDGRVIDEDRAKLDAAASVLGQAFRQEAVPWWHPFETSDAVEANGIQLLFPRELSPKEFKGLYAAFRKASGQDLPPAPIPGGVRVLNFGEGLTNPDFHARVGKALELLPDDFGGGAPELKRFRADSGWLENDWQKDPSGEVYRRRIREVGRPDLQAWSGDLVAAARRLDEQFRRQLENREADARKRAPGGLTPRSELAKPSEGGGTTYLASGLGGVQKLFDDAAKKKSLKSDALPKASSRPMKTGDMEKTFHRFKSSDGGDEAIDAYRRELAKGTLSAKKIQKTRITMKAVQDAAMLLGPEAVAKAKNIDDIKRTDYALMQATVNRYGDLTRSLYEMEKQLDSLGDATKREAHLEKMAKLQREADQRLETMIGGASSSGRNLVYHKIQAQQGFDEAYWMARARRAQGGVLKPDDQKLLRDLIIEGQQAQKRGDTKREGEIKTALARKMAGLDKMGFLEWVSSLRKAGLLANIKTPLRNVTGTTIFQVLEEASKIPAAMADIAINWTPLGTKERTTAGADFDAMRSAVRHSLGGWENGKYVEGAGIADFKNVMKHGVPEGKMTSGEFPRELNFEFASKNGKKVSDALNAYANFVFRVQAATDRPLYEYAFRRSLEAQAQVIALNDIKAGRRSGSAAEAKRAVLEEIAKNQKQHEAMIAQAVSDAEFSTFNNKNVIAQGIGAAQGAIKRRAKEAGAGALGDLISTGVDVIVPFKNTPLNVMARVLDYTGIGGAIKGATSGKIKKVLAEGFSAQEQKAVAEAIGRGLTGAALMYIGYKLAEAGLMTGDFQRRPEDKARNEAVNRSAGSIKIDGKWHQIGTLAPGANLLTIGATLQREAVKGKIPTLALVAGLATKTVLDAPMMQGLDYITELAKDPTQEGERFAANLAGSFVPSGVADIAALGDTKQREARGLEAGIKRRIPGLRNELPAKVSVLGEEMKAEPSHAWNPFLSRPAKEDTDPVAKELVRLSLPIQPVDRKMTEGTRRVEIPKDLYHDLAQEAGERVRTRLEREIESGGYRRFEGDAETQKKRLSDIIESERKRVRSRYKELMRREGMLGEAG